jgi:murein DD-endopeptidase MepM/ murein hydrolase activator NlpD
MPGPVAPARRGWRQLIPVLAAASALSLSLCAGVALGQSGGVSPPSGDSSPPTSSGTTSGGSFKLARAQAKPRKTFYDGVRAPKVAYEFSGDAPTDVRIDVVRKSTGQLIDTFIDPAAVPGATNTAYWDGVMASGALAPKGDYRFRFGTGADPAVTTKDSTFSYFKYIFPVRKRKHSYGDGFGAGRGHQGQDVFARCGSKLVAARGGTVQWNKFQSRAGYYVVIDLKGSKMDHMYAHLKKRSPLKKGTRVKTGQKIGKVGQSGNASGCHLHFEMWSGPGWYEGGKPRRNVTRKLKAWDRWS